MWRELLTRADKGDDGARWDLKCWMKFCTHANEQPPREFDDKTHEMILRGVLKSNSQLALFMITDVFGTEDRFNVPGAVSEGNWSYRLNNTVAEFDREPQLLHKTQMFERLIHETHRAP
jgi:4-alpha-glucanotransferase